MQLFILFSSIAVLPTILTNPVPDTSDYSSFLPGETLAFEDGDSASPMIFDSAQSQGLDFPDSTFLPLQTESNSGSSDMSFETALFSDALDTPLETELFAGSSNSLLESSCTSEGDFQPFAKRDSQICAPKAAVEPSPFLNLPDLDDLERAVGSGDKKERYLPAFPIPLIEGYSENSEVCPKPRRRLCCLGPLSQYAISLNAWTVVSQCRGMMNLPLFFFSIE